MIMTDSVHWKQLGSRTYARFWLIQLTCIPTCTQRRLRSQSTAEQFNFSRNYAHVVVWLGSTPHGWEIEIRRRTDMILHANDGLHRATVSKKGFANKP